MNDHARGFVEDDDIPILEHNPDWKGLWFRDRGRRCWYPNVVLLTRPDDSARPQRRYDAADVSVLDEALHARA